LKRRLFAGISLALFWVLLSGCADHEPIAQSSKANDRLMNATGLHLCRYESGRMILSVSIGKLHVAPKRFGRAMFNPWSIVTIADFNVWMTAPIRPSRANTARFAPESLTVEDFERDKNVSVNLLATVLRELPIVATPMMEFRIERMTVKIDWPDDQSVLLKAGLATGNLRSIHLSRGVTYQDGKRFIQEEKAILTGATGEVSFPGGEEGTFNLEDIQQPTLSTDSIVIHTERRRI